MRLNSVRLLVQNFAACFRFYRDILGLEPHWGDESSDYANFLLPGETSLGLYRRELMAEAVGATSLPLFAPCQDRVALILEVDDVDEFVASLHARNVPLVKEPHDCPEWTMRAAHLRDPDGNLIEVFSPLPQARWSENVIREAERYARRWRTAHVADLDADTKVAEAWVGAG